MAQNGRPEALPRAHRPRAPIMSVPAPTIAPLAPLRAPPPVTLTAPRPESERTSNEYVENPFGRTQPAPNAAVADLGPLHGFHQTNHNHHHHHQQQQQQHRRHLDTTTATRIGRPPPPIPGANKQHQVHPASTISAAITTAPIPAGHHHNQQQQQQQHVSFRKDPPECAARRSILCSECGRCRCHACQQPKRLPSCWLCNNNCLCSADAAVDYASCLCCVKGVYYHYSNSDSGEASCADDPCGCGPERRAARWGCLAVLSVFLPCLWLYWPLQGCKRAVETCYSRYSGQGCRCRPPLTTPEKRLLDGSPDF